MTFSDFGEKLTRNSGILQLMDDLGKPLPKDMKSYQLGGGNPARVPEVDALYRAQMEKILAHGDDFENLLGRYDGPQGRTGFIEAVSSYLSKTYGWKIGPENVAVCNGSQSAFFYLFNLFSGKYTEFGVVPDFATTVRKTILFPLVPEYTGYADQGIEKGTFVSIPSRFEEYDDHTFKYFVDMRMLERYLETHRNVGALCVSRPTNPTGNVLTDDEIHKMASLAAKYGIPLMVDNAYGLPWPDIIFSDKATPYWDENVILSMSLSKIGLPSLRTGIIIARPEIVKALSNLNAIAALASGSMGQALAEDLIRSGELIRVASQAVRPFYEQKSKQTQQWIHQYFAGGDYAIHKSEGAIFLWVLMRDLTIPTSELYSILKKRGVFVMAGENFFFGENADPSMPPVNAHPHYSKCIRLNYARPAEEVEEGIKIIAEVYKRYRK